jgi:hypothetical protein
MIFSENRLPLFRIMLKRVNRENPLYTVAIEWPSWLRRWSRIIKIHVSLERRGRSPIWVDPIVKRVNAHRFDDGFHGRQTVEHPQSCFHGHKEQQCQSGASVKSEEHLSVLCPIVTLSLDAGSNGEIGGHRISPERSSRTG